MEVYGFGTGPAAIISSKRKPLYNPVCIHIIEVVMSDYLNQLKASKTYLASHVRFAGERSWYLFHHVRFDRVETYYLRGGQNNQDVERG